MLADSEGLYTGHPNVTYPADKPKLTDLKLLQVDPEELEKRNEEIKKRFDTSVKAADASTPDKIHALLQQSEIALCAGRAGVQILSEADVKAAGNLLIAADVNAVPPPGVGSGLESAASSSDTVISAKRGV